MKALSLKVKNIGLIEDSTVPLNKPLIILYGEIRQGKTTFLKSVGWALGGSFPDDIIRHGQKEASIEIEFDGGCVVREFYKAKTGEVKARDLVFVRDGKKVPNPTAEIKRLLNPFTLNQNYLLNMTDGERKKFFTELLDVDTTDLDKEAFTTSRQASDLRSKLTGYGDIDLTPVEKVDVTALEAELKSIQDQNEAGKEKRDQDNGEIVSANATHMSKADQVRMMSENSKSLHDQIESLQARKEAVDKTIRDTQLWLKGNPKKPELPAFIPKPTSEVQSKIFDAITANTKHEQYQKNIERDSKRKADEVALRNLEATQRDIKHRKAAKLKEIADNCPVKELKFDEEGNFVYEGTTAGMLSTSQIMRLSSELSACYPEGLGIELLDRGESLGTSIFTFVDRAKAENKTILATIVGELPAKKVPDDVGVFVVENGKATAK